MHCPTTRSLTSAAIVLVLTAVCAAADTILHVVALPPVLEATFSSHDGVLSPFWTDGSVAIDTILLTVNSNAAVGSSNWSGNDDARMWVGAAANGLGVYLCAVVSDGVFLGSSGSGFERLHDVVEVFVDTIQREDIDIAASVFSGFYGMVTWSSYRFRFAMGDTMRWDNVELTRTDWALGLGSWLPLVVDTSNCRLWGIPIEYIRLPDGSRGVELHIPWSFISLDARYEAWPAGTPLANRKLSFAVGYSDYDGPSDSGAIFWTRGSPIDDTIVNYWGELQLASDMPPVAEPQSVVKQTYRVIGNQIAHQTKYFSLTGRTLCLEKGRAAGSVVVSDIVGNGTKYQVSGITQSSLKTVSQESSP
jgi:hypothetical protein